MILVVGGTGRLGREVVTRLGASGHDVRVLTRDPAHADGLDAEVAVGDLRDDASLAGAARGCSVVVAAAHGFLGGRGAGPDALDDRGNGALIRAAVEAGVDRCVLTSVFDARPDHPMTLHRAKYAAEQRLRASGLGWTILRPTAYVETWIDVVGAPVRSGGPAMVFGRGDNPVNFVSVSDVAALVERAVADPDLRGRTLDVPGSDDLTMTQLAECLGATRIRRIPRTALRVIASLLPPIAPAFARQAAAAVVMDSTDMTADATELHAAFPEVSWRRPVDVAAAWAATTRAEQDASRH